MCLEHGAAHVTLLEANETLSELAGEQLKKHGHAASKWTVAHAMSTEFQLAKGAQPFDMLVSELIGSMLHSESMGLYLWDIVKRGIIKGFAAKQTPAAAAAAAEVQQPSEPMRMSSEPVSVDTPPESVVSSPLVASPAPRSGGAPSALVYYMVPQCGVMTARVVRCAHAVGLATGLSYAPMESIYGAVYDTTRHSARADWNGYEAMRFCLASGPWEALSAPIPVLRERYDSVTAPIEYQQQFVFQLAPNVPVDAVVVLEWRAQLSADHMLLHTLDHVASLHPQVRMARWLNWGFTFAPLHHFVNDASLASGACEMLLGWMPADLKLVSKKPAAGAANAAANAPATNDAWFPVASKRLTKVIADTREMVRNGETTV